MKMEVTWVAHVDGGLRVEAVQIGAIEQARRDAGRLLRAAKQQGHVPRVAHPDALRRSARLHKNTNEALRNRSTHAVCPDSISAPALLANGWERQ